MIPPIPIVSGSGALLFDEQGKSYIDAISSWWVNLHGHAHPYIAEKMYEQAMRLAQVIFTGFTHEPAVVLAERLLKLLPGQFSKIFYSDNGSTAVEVALKMVIQYWKNKEEGKSDPQVGKEPRSRKSKILAFKNAYHGDTFGAMSVSGRSIFTDPFRDFLFEIIFIDKPEIISMEASKSLIRKHADEIACFIYEPLLQGAGGMLIHEAGLLDELLTFVKENKILCIADEVLTGFGRTGRLFAGDYLAEQADITCLSKGISGGTLALGVTATTQEIFDAFISDDLTKTFFHGHSFTANPIACAVSLASLDLLEKMDCKMRIKRISEQHSQFIKKIKGTGLRFPTKNIRQLGTIMAFEIESGKDGYLNNISATITRSALEKGIYLRPLGNTVYIMPPYCISEEELNRVYEFLQELDFEK
jgi:adenosylmethionine---8-amino-7-oxononanoate aminotransferase